MIASMFNLDHRLAELRPTEAELRLARQRREAAASAEHRTAATAAGPAGGAATSLPARSTRIAVG